MEKIANLYLEDLFAWGVWQKIRLTNNREISFREIEDFSLEVGKEAQQKGIKYTTYLSRDLTNKFLNNYEEFVTSTDKSIKLNDGIDYKQSLDIFSMGTISIDMLKILLDDKIGKKVFMQENNSTNN